ncbi:LysR family transcriptional regulator [Amphritea balenae]|uniref:LysR family transcriptional regulator n=1 Tax=Amphritea balenae TaxID=452629 RepID=A0A3P1SWZ6_9GAMM|nr:LysR family transcriptional regulator [Amphritea balenae]RRD01578.1 LysR family transcriptional regulator [Amphritea balenae]GGK55777.1 LysR family transcriptional regulator [Amphritea balenae]
MKPILDLELLRTFVMVAQTGELKKAAEQVFRSQGAVSMQIKRLEELTGNQLLERSNRGIRLTEAGETLLGYSDQMLKLSHAALSALSNRDLIGQLCFGIPTDYAQDFLNFFMPVLAAELPNLDARIVCKRSRKLRKMVRNGSVDIAIVTEEKESDQELFLWSERLIWSAPVNGDLEQHIPLPVAMFEDDCIVKDICHADMKTADIEHRSVFSSPVLDNVATAVEQGFAVALLPESLLKTNRTRPVQSFQTSGHHEIRLNMICTEDLPVGTQQRVAECFKLAARNQQR